MLADAASMPSPPGPGPVLVAHRLLIVAAVSCAAIFTLYSARAFSVAGEPAAAFTTVAALGVTIGLGVYLRSLRDLAQKLTPRDPRHP